MSGNSSNSSFDSLDCYDSTVTVFISIALNIARTVLLLPLSIYILCLGHQRWRQQRSVATMSHADVFTYHTAAMQLIWCLGMVLSYCSSSTGLYWMMVVVYCLLSLVYCGEGFFHVLTCVERYLAVVHPIVYLRSRTALGVRIRNMSIGCAWLLSAVWSSLTTLYNPSLKSSSLFCLLILTSGVVTFCSLSVLHVLIRPGPGEGAGDRERVDQSKMKAFHTITAITAVLWLWFLGFLVYIVLDTLPLLNHNVNCVVKVLVTGCELPSSLVLPLLYLHRAGKLSCCSKRR